MSDQITTHGPAPLREGTVLDERFAVGSVLGRGGFGITYLVEDLARGTVAVVKELAPLDARRGAHDDIEFADLGPDAAQRLRHQFTAEARLLQRIRVPRVPQFRTVFHEHQTAYYATDFIEGAKPLSDLVSGTVRLEPEFVLEIVLLLLETLEGLHSHNILHRDVKPSNILLAPSGDPYLVDFGSARQWHADLTLAHAVQFASGYAPLEQLHERERRGPATDLYGLGATTYTLLTGSAPVGVLERIEGAPLIHLSSVRPDVEERLAKTVHNLLEIHIDDRPQSVAAVRKMLLTDVEGHSEENVVRELDAKRRRLRKFRFDAMQCPACGDVLESPEPLGGDICPVCQDGRVKKRVIEEMACPSCRGGILSKIINDRPLKWCPDCSLGRMVRKKSFKFRAPKKWQCEECEFLLTEDGDGAKNSVGETKSWVEWREQSGRSEQSRYCDACTAQFDVLPDGKWKRMSEDRIGDGWTRMYPDEWARVAAGLEPDAGNAYCEACNADFFTEKGFVTLLTDPPNDPNGFAGNYCGELIPKADVPYLAVGKQSGHAGLVCHCCETEFDGSDGEMTLVRSSHTALRKSVGESHTLEDWHRVAQDLPQTGHEEEIDEDIEEALAESYSQGEIDFDPRDKELVWKGSAAEVAIDGNRVGRTKKLQVRNDVLVFGGVGKRKHELVRDIEQIDVEDDVITIHIKGEDPWRLKIAPEVLTFNLPSGKNTVVIGAQEIARRLTQDQPSAL